MSPHRCCPAPHFAGKDGRPGPPGPQGPAGKDGKPWKDLGEKPAPLPKSTLPEPAKDIAREPAPHEGAEAGGTKKGKKGKKLTRSHAVLARLQTQHERLVAQRIRHRQRVLRESMFHAFAVRSDLAKAVRAWGMGRVFVRVEQGASFPLPLISARAQPDLYMVHGLYFP